MLSPVGLSGWTGARAAHRIHGFHRTLPGLHLLCTAASVGEDFRSPLSDRLFGGILNLLLAGFVMLSLGSYGGGKHMPEMVRAVRLVKKTLQSGGLLASDVTKRG